VEQPRILRPTVLFEKRYVWVRLPDGRLALYPDPLRRDPARPGMTAMLQPHTVTLTVSTELVEAFEAHAHLLAPATLTGKAPDTDPCWCTYYLHHPSAPPGAASVTPVYSRSADGTVSLSYLEWYDQAGRPLPAPAPASAPAHGPAH